MNVVCKSVVASLFVISFGAYAATTPQIDFNVEAVIPDNAFYVTAVNGWDSNTQKMQWNESTSSLVSFSKQLLMKNTNGGIKAYLASDPVMSSAVSSDNIPLEVTIAGKTLASNSASAVELYDHTLAAVEKTASITVGQKGNLNTRPAGGTYMGAITMIFDTVPFP